MRQHRQEQYFNRDEPASMIRTLAHMEDQRERMTRTKLSVLMGLGKFR